MLLFFQIPKTCKHVYLGKFAPSTCFFLSLYENMIKGLSCLILAEKKGMSVWDTDGETGKIIFKMYNYEL